MVSYFTRHSVGKKKFFLFGPQLTNYKFKVKPIYRKILLPFLINLFKKMGLRVYVNVMFKNPNVSVTFSGQDAGQLLKNKFALHNAIKEIALNYLRNKISMSSNTRITFKTQAEERSSENRNKDKNSRPRRRPQNQEADLHKIADQVMKEVLETKTSVLIKKLNPADRRIIHLYIEKDDKFKSSSIGDGRFKQVEVALVE